MSMSYLDIILIIPVLWGVYNGWKKGLVNTVAGFAALILGILGAMHLTKMVTGFLIVHKGFTSEYTSIFVFSILFIIIVILVYFVARLVTRLIKAVQLNIFNRLAGVVFNVLKFLVIISFMLVIVDSFNARFDFISKEEQKKSILYKPVKKISPLIFSYLKKLDFPGLPGKEKPASEEVGEEEV